MNLISTEQVEWAGYLRKWIFKDRCPVCSGKLGFRHSVAHVGSCNFNGPALWSGFLSEVKNGQWSKVVEPFSRLTSMDMMACELLRYPKAKVVCVWVEVDLVMAGDQYLVYFERVAEYDVSKIEEVTSIVWTRS